MENNPITNSNELLLAEEYLDLIKTQMELDNKITKLKIELQEEQRQLETIENRKNNVKSQLLKVDNISRTPQID